MNIVVRYYSRSGNTKLLAETIASACNVEAISVENENSKINENVDLLFIGGALYAYGLDKHLKDYLLTLPKDVITKALIFSTSWLSKHAIVLIKKQLMNLGIDVIDEYIYAKGKPNEKDLEHAKEIVNKYIGG